jgi:hypothetical protein
MCPKYLTELKGRKIYFGSWFQRFSPWWEWERVLEELLHLMVVREHRTAHIMADRKQSGHQDKIWPQRIHPRDLPPARPPTSESFQNLPK